MAKVNPEEHRKSRSKLSLDDLDGGDQTALTMVNAEEVETKNDDGSPRKSLAITFEETGDKVYWPNVTSLKAIIEVYGDDTDDWTGNPLALARNEGTFNGKPYENIQVAPLSLWAAILKGCSFKVGPEVLNAATRAAVKNAVEDVPAKSPAKKAAKRSGRGR